MSYGEKEYATIRKMAANYYTERLEEVKREKINAN